MPKAHQAYLEWTPSRIINWAKSIGSSTQEMVALVMENRNHPQQGYRSCMGIISLGKRYTNDRLEAACIRALAIGSYSYKSIKSILETELDKRPLPNNTSIAPIINHANIRGADYYNNN